MFPIGGTYPSGDIDDNGALAKPRLIPPAAMTEAIPIFFRKLLLVSSHIWIPPIADSHPDALSRTAAFFSHRGSDAPSLTSNRRSMRSALRSGTQRDCYFFNLKHADPRCQKPSSSVAMLPPSEIDPGLRVFVVPVQPIERRRQSMARLSIL